MCATINVALSTLIFAITIFVPYMVKNIPSQYINMPNKSYWLAMENKPKAMAKLNSCMLEFGVVFLGFVMCINIMTIEANLSEPVKLDKQLFAAYLIAFLLYVVFWCARLFLTFRAPKGQTNVKDPYTL